MINHIPFNKPFLTGQEIQYIQDAVSSGKISGNGDFTKLCQNFFAQRGFGKCLLTTSCTDALEMAAILIEIQPGDEVIVPSYTFVSTANAFILRGAKIVFADSMKTNPNINADSIESLVTSKTKAIVPVHYAGIACDMDQIMGLAKKYNLFVVEDAAQSINSFYKGKPLGSIGHLATFSFHETKNIHCGEGGMLVVNDDRFKSRAEIIWEKGTNRSAFFKGEVDKYGWVDVGSSFLPSDMLAAFLFAQLERIDFIQSERKKVWDMYYSELKLLEDKGFITLPIVPNYASNNNHMFYMVCNKSYDRERLINHLKKNDINAVFHYISLHKSPYYQTKHDGRELTQSDLYSDNLIRLPLWVGMPEENIKRVVREVKNYYYQEF
ncbi:MAG: dTDP-4-amino-4,6-dideoxygalactose transaminase [Cyclobacteriaceae bacterium]|nr:dTDP-4-amino-4,6-dideoxygalactose transaminase [Cyclobacteriaceae bacterium]